MTVSLIRMVVLKVYKPTRRPFKVFQFYGPTVFFYEEKSSVLAAGYQERLEELGDSLLGRIADVTRVQLDIYVSVHERQTKALRMQLAKKRARLVTQKILETQIARDVIVQELL